MIHTKFGYMTAMEARCIGNIDKELAIKRRKEQENEKERIAKKLLKKLNLHISDDLKNVNTSNFNFNYLDGRLNYQEQKQDYLGSRLICINGEPEEQRKFKVINSYFISDHSLNKNELAEKYHVDRKTIDRDVKKAISDLSVMIFGIDGLNDMSK